MSTYAPTVAVDFDGVIHAYSRGWADGTIYDPPLPGALDGLARLREHYAVFIHTTREPTQVAAWLHQAGVPVALDHEGTFWNRRDMVLVTNRKLPAVAYIDDRAYTFRNWAQTMADFGGEP